MPKPRRQDRHKTAAPSVSHFNVKPGSSKQVDDAKPMDSQPLRERRALAALAFVIPMAVYFITLCRTIYWGDGIELTTAASVLGVPHPTGYPLFMLLGRIAMAVFAWGEPAMRMNLMCALAGAGAVLMMFLLLRAIITGWMRDAIESERIGAMLALGGALVFAFSRSQWFHSVTTEVYTLHLFFVLAMFYVFVRWRQDRRDVLLIWLMGLCSLALTHHTTSLFAAPLVLLAWWQWGSDGGIKSLKSSADGAASRKLMGCAALALVLPFSLYLYLPVRAAADPAINWGNPSTWDRFLWVVTGGDFKLQYFMRFNPVTPFTAENYPQFFEERLRGLIDVAGNDFLMIFDEARAAKLIIFLGLLMFALFGLLYLSKVSAATALGWVLYLAGMLFFVFAYNVSDFGAFYYPLWALMWPVALVGVVIVVAQISARLTRPLLRPLALALGLMAAVALVFNWPFCNKASDRGAVEYAHRILDAVEPGAMIVTIVDNDIYPLWYAQIVEERRPDVIVVGSNFLSSAWYESFFSPEQINQWELPIEQRPLLYYNQFYELIINRLIQPNLSRGPVYTTFYDEQLARNFRLEFVSTTTVSDDMIAHLDSFPPQPFLIRLFPAESAQE